MKRLIVTAAAFASAGALAPSVLAAQTLLVSPTGPDPKYDGFDVAVEAPWRIDDCTGSGTFTDGGEQSASVWDWYDNQTVNMQFDSTPAPEWGELTQFTANCALTKKVVTYPLKWRWFSKRRSGTNTSSRSHSSACYINGLSGALLLDCWGGLYAQARYRFHLPDDARQITRRIVGEVGCCSPGSVQRYWTGNTATVRVTTWRSYLVERVKVTYQHRVRVRKVTYEHDTGTGVWPS